jgi:polyadenylate-binding protein
LLTEQLETFRKLMKENDNVYILKDKVDKLDCCAALKKKDRIKKLKQLYDRIKKQIKEKYRFCNLYIKNLPDNFDDNNLRELFAKYGDIRSCKAVRKELFSSYLGIKRSVKVFGYVCFNDAASARDAKAALHGITLGNNNQRLFVDYHQTKNERNDYLKLKMINQAGKMKDMPPMMRNLPPHSKIKSNP